MKFKCLLCNYESFIKNNVIYYINKKNKCGDLLKIVEIENDIICNDCNKEFLIYGNLKRY